MPELELNLKYKIRPGEELQFLDEDEQQEMNKVLAKAVGDLAPTATRDDQVVAARDARRKYLNESLSPQLVAVRISAFMLKTAVEARYRVIEHVGPGAAQAVVRIPRKAEGKTSPGRWWGEILERLDDISRGGGDATALVLDAVVAQWLVSILWQDDKVQNGFPPQLQAWMNTFDEEMQRLALELPGSSRKR